MVYLFFYLFFAQVDIGFFLSYLFLQCSKVHLVSHILPNERISSNLDICVACVIFYFLIVLNLTPKKTREQCSMLFKLITDADESPESTFTDSSKSNPVSNGEKSGDPKPGGEDDSSL